MINQSIVDTMLRTARQARSNAYVPHSCNAVGACVLTSDGTLYSGCTIESTSYGLSNCAERVALQKAISDGKQTFDGIAIVADNYNEFIPCGACLQYLAEFNVPEIIISDLDGNVRTLSIEQILPYSQFLGANAGD